MEIDTYLERINYTDSLKPDTQTLYGLHLAHMLAVPFENLDIGLKRPIYIDERSIWDKIVINKRGGFCYELNGLFAWLLKQIGFDVTYLDARVFNRDGELGSHFDHLTLLVQIPGQSSRWVADVGFGDSFNEPLHLETGREQHRGLRAYRIEQTGEGYIVWQKDYDGSWERQYFFDLQAHKFPDDYEVGCTYHQTSPKSSFTHKSIISKATPNGRVSLEEDRLILTKTGQRIERPVTGDEDYRKLLKRHFDIEL